jgi:CRP/FNR family transcriptional regulator, cyclic AMP receptor protein
MVAHDSRKGAMETLEILRNLPLFGGLSDDALHRVADRVVVRRLARDQILFREGQACHGLYVVVSGRVMVYQATTDGREYILDSARPGQSLAELPLFDGGPYPASARAAEESTLLFLSQSDFQTLYRSNPEIADAVVGHLGTRMRQMVRLVERLSLRDVPARLAATLLDYAAAAGALQSGTAFRLPRTHYELAAELATSRESVTRAFTRLRREGAIAQDGAGIRIIDLARLRTAAGMPAAAPPP